MVDPTPRQKKAVDSLPSLNTLGRRGGESTLEESNAGFVPFTPTLSISDLAPPLQKLARLLYSEIAAIPLSPEDRLSKENRDLRSELGGLIRDGAYRSANPKKLLASVPPELFETQEYKDAVMGTCSGLKGLPHVPAIRREQVRGCIEACSANNWEQFETDLKPLPFFHRSGYGSEFQLDVESNLWRGVQYHLKESGAIRTRLFLMTSGLHGPLPEGFTSGLPTATVELLRQHNVETFTDMEIWLRSLIQDSEVHFTSEGLKYAPRPRPPQDREIIPPGRIGYISEGVRVTRDFDLDP